jgi:hypothetical protein
MIKIINDDDDHDCNDNNNDDFAAMVIMIESRVNDSYINNHVHIHLLY